MSAALALSWPMCTISSREVRACACGELVAGMAQVVKVDAGQADSGKSRQPGAPAEVAVTHRHPVRAGEDEGRSGAEPVKKLPEIGRDEIGERDSTAASARHSCRSWLRASLRHRRD